MVKNRLKEIRMKAYMMEPQKFAKLINVNYRTYYSWEKGLTGPSLEKALEVAETLKLKVEDIWYRE